MSRGLSRDRAELELQWRPTAAHREIVRRAQLLAKVRGFFAERGVLEVETPLLQPATVTDPQIESVQSQVTSLGGEQATYFLQTSPEFAMKRLLCSGSGSIYQICKAFRSGEQGAFHNIEFTMLEWYRVGFDHHDLMDEVDELLNTLLGWQTAERLTYRTAFERALSLDPHRAADAELRLRAESLGLSGSTVEAASRDELLDFLVGTQVAPTLGRGRPTFVFDYPGSQAALARTRRTDDGVVVAERFEVFAEGIELANGFHELQNADEQRRRFESDREHRQRQGQFVPPLDERFLLALEAGLPACSGIAVGIDRLHLVAAGSNHLEHVLTWPTDRV